MKNISTTKLIGALIVIVAIAAAIVYFGHSHGSDVANAPVASDTAPIATSSDSAASSTASIANAALIYEVSTAKKSYAQNEQFNILVTIINNTDQPQNFNFPNGCQGEYVIGSFDSLAHTRCTPDPTMFTVQPHQQATVNLTHYPSVYTIPVGSYTVKSSIVGYGGGSIPLTITK